MDTEKERRWWNEKAASFDTIYTGEKNPLSALMDRVLRWDMGARMRFALEKTAPAPGRRILDVACGTGRFSHSCAERGAWTLGVDLSEKMLEIAASITQERGLSGCEFLHGDFLKIPFDEQFDAVVALGLFDYLHTPEPYLRKMLALSNGPVVASFPRKNTVRSLVRTVRLRLLGQPVFFYTDDDIRSLAARCGGNTEEIRIIGQLFCVVFTRSPSPERAL